MEFKVENHYKSEFSKLLASTCKKFKVEYTVEFSEEQEIGTRTVCDNRDQDWSIDCGATFGAASTTKTYPVMGYIATVTVPELDRVEDTGFKYLGCVKDDDMISVHPTDYATEKGFHLSSLKEEIESFPCAECGKKIARKIIHVFESPEGDIAVYGSGCSVKKFGINFTAVMDKFFKAVSIIEDGYEGDDDYFGGGSCGTTHLNASFFTFLSFKTIYSTGYVSGSKAWNEGGVSTKEHVLHMMNVLSYADRNDPEFIQITNDIEDFKTINKLNWDEFLAWLPEFKKTLSDDDFGFNMNAVADMMEQGTVTDRMAGFAVYVTFRYWQDALAPKEPKIEWNEDYSQLNVGDKLKDIGSLTVEITNVYVKETQWGTTRIYTFREIDTDIKYKWFSTSATLDEDEVYEIYSGTIKDFQSDDKYGKAVILTRCRVR